MKAFVFGGRRGLSLSLVNELISSSFDVTVLTRDCLRSAENSLNCIYIDIDDSASIDNALLSIHHSFSVLPAKIIVYLLYGGGLRVDSTCDKIDPETYVRIFNHNIFIQHKITNYFINSIKPSMADTCISFIYIFSAVSKHYFADPLYVASKLALEGMMKAFVCMRKPNVTFSGFRLGMVDVDYKYFHRLSTEDPVAFKQILDENLPSQYFPSTDEVAKFMVQATTNSFLTNGMICDISGGNSWFVK